MPDVLFDEPPRLEWHSGRPFAFAQLPVAYAAQLTELALRNEERIANLPVTVGWESLAAENPTGSRYGGYNTFLLDAAYLRLFFALQATYRFLAASIGVARQTSVLQSWFNVHRNGQRLHRHLHAAKFIGSFAAHAEGSHTLYGPSAVADALDYPVPNRNGQLLVTVGRNHWHEVTPWQDTEHPRVSYAFDIIESSSAASRGSGRVVIPFDSPWADVQAMSADTGAIGMA